MVFVCKLIGFGNQRLMNVPLGSGNTAIIYCGIMTLLAFLCSVFTLILKVENKGFIDKNRKRLYITGCCVPLLFSEMELQHTD